MTQAPGRHAVFARALDQLAGRDRLRALQGAGGSDFASNDYLGLAGHPRIAAAIRRALDEGISVGATGSRLLRGNAGAHEALEVEAAAFFGSESALMMGGGYQANLALMGTLPQTGDLLLLDALCHASANEGARLSRAEVARFRHNDPGHAAEVITAWRRGGGRGAVWIAVESLYSMDGDRAPLAELSTLAAAEGWLLVDEAHATGVFGTQGRGLAGDLDGAGHVITLHTLGKALGGSGALICGPRVIRDFLVNRARPFIFATAPSPLMAEAGREALRILAEEPQHQAALQARIALFGSRLAAMGLPASGSQIAALIVGADGPAMDLAAAIRARGFDVRGIRPPTVPEGTARLRISLTLNPTEAEMLRLADTIEELWPAL
ncbi:8-amino-7-oxononanoate synthase [Paracoccus suum]|uniref:8-amino-7-oxononanoate synthase n=1 Tax=Paracoccus suum TaxID=2259340 RepID=A0A344PHZ8_9RHOB|nr:8-amino-7-oxononanoate synthase [Paracoccus suum]AXC49003.1 8-amino-7-oxononanoate synthase [Paracoccus suum]